MNKKKPPYQQLDSANRLKDYKSQNVRVIGVIVDLVVAQKLEDLLNFCSENEHLKESHVECDELLLRSALTLTSASSKEPIKGKDSQYILVSIEEDRFVFVLLTRETHFEPREPKKGDRVQINGTCMLDKDFWFVDAHSCHLSELETNEMMAFAKYSLLLRNF